MFYEVLGVFAKVFGKVQERLIVIDGFWKRLFCLSLSDLFVRIAVSIAPPFTLRYKTIFVDIIGPSCSVSTLILLLNYGKSYKQFEIEMSPVIIVLSYLAIMPIICFTLNFIGQSSITFLELFSLIGYALYGHIFTLSISFLMSQGNNDAHFFFCFILFGGLSTLRIVLLQLQLIPQPIARLLICTIVSVLHMLFLIFLHFTFMHPLFLYVHE